MDAAGLRRAIARPVEPAEEPRFRGAVQGNLRTASGPVAAIGLIVVLSTL